MPRKKSKRTYRRRQKWGETWAEPLASPMSPDTGLVPQPDTIFVLLNGRLECFKLRTMPVYVPVSELSQ